MLIPVDAQLALDWVLLEHMTELIKSARCSSWCSVVYVDFLGYCITMYEAWKKSLAKPITKIRFQFSKKVILALFFNFGSFYKTNFCSSFWFRLKIYANDFFNKLMAINRFKLGSQLIIAIWCVARSLAGFRRCKKKLFSDRNCNA